MSNYLPDGVQPQRRPTPPAGYKWVDLGSIYVLACKKCGSLVNDHRQHNDHHRKNDKNSVSFRNG